LPRCVRKTRSSGEQTEEYPRCEISVKSSRVPQRGNGGMKRKDGEAGQSEDVFVRVCRGATSVDRLGLAPEVGCATSDPSCGATMDGTSTRPGACPLKDGHRRSATLDPMVSPTWDWHPRLSQAIAPRFVNEKSSRFRKRIPSRPPLRTTDYRLPTRLILPPWRSSGYDPGQQVPNSPP
jgi:hypothetical protein